MGVDGGGGVRVSPVYRGVWGVWDPSRVNTRKMTHNFCEGGGTGIVKRRSGKGGVGPEKGDPLTRTAKMFSMA